MAFSRILREHSDPELDKILLQHLPNKDLFYTNRTDCTAFSGEYRLIADSKISGANQRALAGAAFDYMARILISKRTGHNFLFHTTNAQRAIEIVQKEAKTSEQQAFAYSLRKLYLESQIRIWRYFYVEEQDFYTDPADTFRDICKVACFIALIDGLPHLNTFDHIDCKKFTETITKSLVSDVLNMTYKFANSFFPSLPERKHNIVFSPFFFGLSGKLSGAVADLYFDETLYEFKTSRYQGYKQDDLAQLWGYYLIDCLAKASHDKRMIGERYIPFDWPINRLAFYRPRFNAYEYYDLKHTKKEELLETLLNFNNYLRAKISADKIEQFVKGQMYLSSIDNIEPGTNSESSETTDTAHEKSIV